MKILIISYYAFPLNAVASYRIDSFCEGFTKQGADVTLLTRHWDETFQSWEDTFKQNIKEVEISNIKSYREIRLPYFPNKIERKSPLLNTISVIKSYVLGELQPEIEVYDNFKDYAIKLLKDENDFDLILTSVQPEGLTKLAYYVSKETNVPYVVDFRDFLNNQFLVKNNTLTLREKTINFFKLFHTKRYLKNAELAITVSPILKDVLENKLNKKTILTLNGYEEEFFHTQSLTYRPNKTFTIRHLGTIYPGSNFIDLLHGMKKFQKYYPEKKIKIELIGGHNDKVEGEFQELFNTEELLIIKTRIPKKEVVEKTMSADVLMLPWNIYIGNYGTKIFDYLASGSHILLCPPDNSVVEELVRNYENGSVANTADEVYEILVQQYNLWEQGKNKSKINNYPQFARENIAVELYQKLQEITK